MRHAVVSIFDHKAGIFSRPAFVTSVGIAHRSFSDEVNRDHPENQMFHHPEDFQLHLLGFWDDESGDFEDNPSDLPLVNASSVKVSHT